MQEQGIKLIPTQLGFREKFYQELFKFVRQIDLPQKQLNSQLNHLRIQLSKQEICVLCAYKRKKKDNEKLQSKQTSRPRSGCSVCRMPLCKGCWDIGLSYYN